MMEQQNLFGRMEQMEQSLTSSASQQARRQGEGLQQDLARLNQALQNLQADFDGAQRQQMSDQLRGAMAGLVDLSQRQEGLVEEIDHRSGSDDLSAHNDLSAENYHPKNNDD